MKQTLFIVVLVIGIYNVKGSAQEKNYKVEDDGFEWYEIERVVNGEIKCGAEDRYGI